MLLNLATVPEGASPLGMTRVQCYTIAIRAINQKMGTVKRRKVRLALALARDFLANDPVLAPQSRRTSESVPREELLK